MGTHSHPKFVLLMAKVENNIILLGKFSQTIIKRAALTLLRRGYAKEKQGARKSCHSTYRDDIFECSKPG
jgi:hypothetical protein